MNRGETKTNSGGRFTIRFISVDILLIPISLIGAFLLRFDFQIPQQVFSLLKHYIPILLLLKISSFAVFGLYRGMWRYTSISDLINIIKGEMSFVGPRPLGEQEHQNLCKQIPGFEQRLELYPGLTGLAQIYTNREDSESKLFYDLKYANQMSLLLDVKLIFHSVWVTLRARWERQRDRLKEER